LTGRCIDKGVFPGSSSNHHLETLMALSVSTCEMLEFGGEPPGLPHMKNSGDSL